MTEHLEKYIDHTLLKPETTMEQIEKICEEAKEYGFKSVCINPTWIKHAAMKLKDTDVEVCTVVGFPLGANSKEVKAYEVKQAIEDGATEVDMVINIGELKSDAEDYVYEDIKSVVEAAGEQVLTKVIIETSLLDKNEKVRACELAKKAGADFVKTSTGFSIGGATVEDVKLIRATIGPEMGIKASGGVRSKEDAEAMIEAGATRIGASSSVKIVSN